MTRLACQGTIGQTECTEVAVNRVREMLR